MTTTPGTRSGGFSNGIGWLLLLGMLLSSTDSVSGQSSRPKFSAERGFYESPFDLILSTTSPTATIRYTVNGSEPSSAVGTVFVDHIPIETTSVIRAAAFEADGTVSTIETHSYLFVKDILLQPKEIPGWQALFYPAGGTIFAQHDYEMDPDIVGDPAYAEDIRSGLLSIPSLSLVMDRDQFWEVHDGDEERSVSVEVLYPDEPKASHSGNGGLVAHSQNRLKRSLRLNFKSEFGDAKFASNLLSKGVHNGEGAADLFDRLVLRAGNNRSWARIWNEGRATYARDQWYRDTQISMSGVGARGVFVHMYVNGLYWGLYNVVERPDTRFAASYFGGDESDWFSIRHGEPHQGNPARWNHLVQVLAQTDLRNSANYSRLAGYLDLEGFVDYVMLSWFTRMTDWPDNNWWLVVRNQPGGPAIFIGWDNEWSWYTTGEYEDGGAWVHPDFRSDQSYSQPDAAGLWHDLRVNPDFLVYFADRVYQNSFNGGPLSDEASRSRWSALTEHLRNPIVAESARWGDAMKESGAPTRTRNSDWQQEVDRVDALMDGNANRFLAALREQGYYPDLDPPMFSRPGGPMLAQENLEITRAPGSDSGEIYYTIDGTDPRQSGGLVAPTAIAGGTSVSLSVDQTMRVRARHLDGGSWSAVQEGFFLFPSEYAALKVTELMYNPASGGPGDPDTYEFLELQNAGEEAIDLSGASFSVGISFTFSTPTIINPGNFLVLASDSVAFKQRYGMSALGQYQGRLANEGERVSLVDVFGELLWEVKFNDRLPWPEGADGEGYSLVLRHPTQALDPQLPGSWRISQNKGGSPGSADPASTPLSEYLPNALDFVGDVYPNPAIDRAYLPVRMNTTSSLRLELFDILGRSVGHREEALLPGEREDRLTISAGDLPSGTYFVRLIGREVTYIRPLVVLR